jgi:hypothetical protein
MWRFEISRCGGITTISRRVRGGDLGTYQVELALSADSYSSAPWS